MPESSLAEGLDVIHRIRIPACQHAVGKIKEMYEKYPGIGTLLPAAGYSDEQVADLERTVNAVDCDYVVIGTPIDLRRVINIERPSVRVGYDLKVVGTPTIEDLLKDYV